MFWTFFRFEWRCAWRYGGPALLFLAAAVGTVVMMFNAHFGSWYANAPIVIEWFQGYLAMPVSLILAAVFFIPSAVRDFAHRTDELVFSAPFQKGSYFIGRFAGTVAAALIPGLGISAGLLAAPHLPWGHQIFGPVNWPAHAEAFLLFALPNALIAGGCVYAFASWVRQPFTALAAILALLAIGYGAPHVLLADVKDHRWAAVADPFGWTTFQVVLERWHPGPGDPRYLTLRGLMLYDRAAWLAVAITAIGLSWWRFDFQRRSERGKRPAPTLAAAPAFRAQAGAGSAGGAGLVLRQWGAIVRFDLAGAVRETLFVVLAIGLSIEGLVSFWGRWSHPRVYWTAQTPDLALILAHMEDEFTPLFVVMLTVSAGYLVWRERTARIQEIDNALPVGRPTRYAAKFSALTVLIAAGLLIIASTGLAAGLLLGERHFDFGSYAAHLLFWNLPFVLTLGVGALLIQTACPGKFAGYAASAAILLGNAAVWAALDIRSGLVTFAYRPFVNDAVQGADSSSGLLWFNLYWLGWCGLLAVVTILLWPSGMNSGWTGRWRTIGAGLSPGLRRFGCAAAVLTAVAGVVIYYNISLLTGWRTRKQEIAVAIAYEKTYGRYAGLPQPVVTDVVDTFDLAPERRGFALEASEWLENRTDQPIGELHFTVDRGYETSLEVPNSYPRVDDRQLGYRIYRLFVPMAPGERRQITFRVSRTLRGFENDVSHLNLTRGGEYLDWRICPTLGYSAAREAGNDKFGAEARRKAGLLTRASQLAAPRSKSGPSPRLNATVTISTAPDQIAVAPGALEREWLAGGRRCFRYRLQEGALHFLAISSAPYRIARSEAAGVKLAIYYLPKSDGNVGPIMQAFRDSVSYYARAIGPCPQPELRMVELPRQNDFAVATSGALFLSENQGFLAQPVRSGFNPLRYLIAYELASQWWGHDVNHDRIDAKWSIDAAQQDDACRIAAEGRYRQALMEWMSPIRANNLLPAPIAARLGHWTALGGLGLAYVEFRCGENTLSPLLAAAHAALRSPRPTSWGLPAFEAALASQVPPDKRYLITHLERDILPLKLQLRDASTQRRKDGTYETTVRLMAERERVEDRTREPEPPSGFVHLTFQAAAPSGAPRNAPPKIGELTVAITQTWTNASFISSAPPATVSSSDDFDDWFVYDPTVFATYRRSIPVTERDRHG